MNRHVYECLFNIQFYINIIPYSHTSPPHFLVFTQKVSKAFHFSALTSIYKQFSGCSVIFLCKSDCFCIVFSSLGK